MKRSLLTFTLTWALVTPIWVTAQQPALQSAFLPPVGQTVNYRFSNTTTTPKASKNEAGRLTLTAVAGNEIKATVTLDNKAPRDFDFQVDQTGAFSPTAKSPGNGHGKPGATEQALMLQLSLAARIGEYPGEEMSFPVLLDVPWASSPVNPILYVKPTALGAFVATAEDTTSINPPQQTRPHILRSVAIGVGAGALAGAIGGTAGRVVGPVVTIVSIATRSHSGPQSADVTLHIKGQLANGRLRTLSCNREYTVHANKHPRTFNDQWLLVAE